MSSEKDEKNPEIRDVTIVGKVDDSDDDPSLEETDDPVVSEDELVEAESKLAEEAGSDGSDDESDIVPVDAASDGNGGDDDGNGGDDTPVSAESDDDPTDEEELEDDELEEDGDGAQMSLLEHLGELRLRLTKSFIAVAVGMVACYGFADKMFDILMAPMIDVFQKQAASKPSLPLGFYDDLRQALTQVLMDKGFKHSEDIRLFVDALQQSLIRLAHEGGHFQYTYPAEAFFSHIKIAIVAGVFLVSPYVFAQIWGFIAPGLYAHERKWMVPMALVSAMFFTGGALFGYFQVFPYAFDFFAGFSTNGIQFTPKLNEYLSFCLKLLFAFGFVFELPLFIFFLARLGMVSSRGLRKKRKYAILIGFILAAVLTPPDPFTQCLMAGPLIILYEVGIWVAFFFGKKEERHLKKLAEEEAAKEAEMDKAAAEGEAGTDEA